VGRTRTHNRHLPRRVYQRRGKYYFAHPDGRWIPLGDEYGAALRAYSEVIGQQPIGSLSDLFDRYAVEILPKKAPRTQRDQFAQLELLRGAFGQLKPHELTPRMVIRYRNARGQKSQTQANQELALLSHICVTAVEWEALESNPCRDVKKFKLEPRDRYVEHADFTAMRASAGPRLRVLMDLALITGQREGDLLSLRWEQIEKDGIRFKQGKTGKALIVTWSSDLRKVVARARQIEPRGETVVATSEGKQYSTDAFQSLWQRARARAKKAGFERTFPFNDLRAKSASDDGLALASQRLGHSDTKITERVYRRAPRKVQPLNIGRADLFGHRKESKGRKRKAQTA
jgi:integrase